MNHINICLTSIAASLLYTRMRDTYCLLVCTVASLTLCHCHPDFHEPHWAEHKLQIWWCQPLQLGFGLSVCLESAHITSPDRWYPDILIHSTLLLRAPPPLPHVPKEMHGWASLFSSWGVPHAWLMFRLISLTDSCSAVRGGLSLWRRSRPLRSPLIFAPFWQT